MSNHVLLWIIAIAVIVIAVIELAKVLHPRP